MSFELFYMFYSVKNNDDSSMSTTIMLHLILIVDHLEDDLCHEIGHSEGSAASQSHPQN